MTTYAHKVNINTYNNKFDIITTTSYSKSVNCREAIKKLKYNIQVICYPI